MRSVNRLLLATAAVGLLAAAPLAAPDESRFVLVSAARDGQPLAGLQADDFVIENAGVPCDIVRVTPAAYPVAVVLDTSSYARGDFPELRRSVERLLDGLTPRDVGIYTSGEPVSRVLDFTRDQTAVAKSLATVSAGPSSTTHTLAAVLRAATDLRRLDRPVTGLIVLSAGGLEMSPPGAKEVAAAVLASRSMVDVIDLRTLRLDRGTPQSDGGEVLQALASRTHGRYIRGAGTAAYSSGIDVIRRQLDAESILEYSVASGARQALALRVVLPGAVVTAIGLDTRP